MPTGSARDTGTPRVAITGIGTVNACTAGGADAVAGALARSHSPIGPVRGFSGAGSASGLAAQVEDGVLASLLDRDEARRLSRICQLAVVGCRLALADARRDAGPDLGIAVGTELGDFRSSEEFAAGFLRRGPTGLSPMIFPHTVMNTMAASAAIAVGAKGPAVTVNQATLAGDLAVARGAALLRAGRAEAVIAGGVDEVCEVVYRRLAELGVLSPMGGRGPEGCRPYDPEHNGPVLGEGATFVVLEDLDAARARGATVWAVVSDAAWGNVPLPPHRARAGRADHASPVQRLLRSRSTRAAARCYGAGNGDPHLDDWERALLRADTGREEPPTSLATRFGQHGGLGALRVAAGALDVARGAGPVLVHGIARGGCRSAIILDAPPPAP